MAVTANSTKLAYSLILDGGEKNITLSLPNIGYENPDDDKAYAVANALQPILLYDRLELRKVATSLLVAGA